MFLSFYFLCFLDVLFLYYIFVTNSYLTFIGHLLGWKRIKYWRIFAVLFGYDEDHIVCSLFNDNYTHPQAIVTSIIDFLSFLSILVIIIVFGSVDKKTIEPWIQWFWLVDLVLFGVTLLKVIVIKRYAKKLYMAFCVKNLDFFNKIS